MTRQASADVTTLLLQWQAGDAAARDQLMPAVYDELHRLAHLQLSRLRPGDTLQTTALIHEAYLRLVEAPANGWNDRVHFFSLAARAMRFILIDAARQWGAAKRGGGAAHTVLDTRALAVHERADELLALDEALERLAAFDPDLARIVELRFFGGMTHEEVAAAMDLSNRTARRRWQTARLWLYDALQAD